MSSLVCRIVVLSALCGSAFAQLTITGYKSAAATLATNGGWTLSVPSQNWKFAGALGAGTSTSGVNSGTDNLGAYQELAFNYSIGQSSRTGSIRVYPSQPYVLFTVTYNNATANTSPFPSLTAYPKLSHISFSGEFAQPDFSNMAPDSPVVYFDNNANSYILSAASNFMTATSSIAPNGTLSTGISTSISTLPAGFVQSTLLTFGTGINATFLKWGQGLTTLSGKKRPAYDADPLLKSISYWTDNGASYYYNYDGTYEDTLNSVKSEFASKSLALGSMQLDSWWYPKGPTDTWSDHQGIWSYTAAPDLFPDGLPAFQKKLGVPLIAHSRWIDAQSPYRSQYTMSGDVSIDPKFWNDAATYLKSANVAVYEQDWLANNAKASFNLTDPAAYLGNMASAMAAKGITIQYCTAAPAHYLQSTLYSNVTTTRNSNDRFQSDRWTYFFYSGRLASALGTWPFTDTFMSSETDNLIAATMSAGPIGVGDAKGNLQAQNLLKSARADGVLVKPDVTGSPVDSVFIADAQGLDSPMVVSAYTDFGGGLRGNYIFAYSRGTNRTFTVDPATYGITGQSYLYDYLRGTGKFLDVNQTATMDVNSGIAYLILMPVGKTGIAFLGDQGHYATLGKARIPTFTDTGRVDVTVNFAPGERTRTLFGFSSQPVTATAIAGGATAAVWDPNTQIFTLQVVPTAGSAHVRLIQSFDPGGYGTSSSGCGFRCIGGGPVPGPIVNK